jgi:PAS domain S-box-containing protein
MTGKRVRDLENEIQALKSQISELQARIPAPGVTKNTFSDANLLNMLIRVSPLAIIVLDKNDRVVVWSPACERLFGWSAEEVIGRENPIVPAEKADEYNRLSADVYDGKNLIDLDVARRHKDGYLVNVSLSTAVLYGDDGQINGRMAIITDMTERKKAEAQLRQSEEHFRLLFERHHAVMLLVDPDSGMIIDANPSAVEYYGYSRQTLCAMNIGQINGLPVSELRTELQRAKYEKRNYFVFPHRLASGESRIVEVYSSPIEIKGQVVLFSIIHDVTERVEAEKRESALAQNYRIVADNTYDWEYWVDPKGQFVYCSPSCARITGYSAEEFLNDSSLMDRIIHPDDINLYIAHRKNSGKRGHSEELEFRVLRPDGSICWLGHACQAIFDDSGTFLGMRGSNRDITERKQADAELKNSEARYRAVVENQTEMIARWRLDGTRTFVNEAYCRYFGIPIESAIGTNFLPYVEQADRQAVSEKIARLTSGQAALEVDVHRVILPNGQIAWNEWREQPIFDETGTVVVEIQSVGRDITEQVQAETNLRASLDEKEALLRELYHRTKNNMQVIIAMLELQASYVEDPTVTTVFEEMENRIRSMSLVHQKLYQSQNLSSINFKDYISDLASLLLENYRLTHHQVRLQFDMEDVFVLIDTAIPCGLIINELITNAIKHAFPQGREGEIRIKIRLQPSGAINITVADNGVGVPDGFDFHRDGKMGTQIIYALAEHQLRGKVKFSGGHGVTCQIKIRQGYYSPRI